MISCCPKCGGTEGVRFTVTETHTMFAEWGEAGEAGDSGINASWTLPRCGDCGYRLSRKTLDALGWDP